MRHALAVKSETDSTLVLEGWGVVFGSEDLTGDYFTKSTDFWLDKLGATKPVLYNHGFDSTLKKSVIGSGVLEAKATEDGTEGLWFTAQLDKSNAYVKQIRALADAGLLGTSSGAISHLVERGEAKSDGATELKSWPIGEVSLTVTPAEPRTIGVAEVRSLIEHAESLKAVIAEAPTKPVDVKATSFEQVRDQVYRVLNRTDTSPWDLSDPDWTSVVGTFADYVIVERVDYDGDGDGGLFKFPYSVDASGAVSLGDPVQVTTEYPAITKSLVAHAAALSAVLPEVKATEPQPADAALKAAELIPEETEMSQEILDAIKALSERVEGIDTAVKAVAGTEEPAVKTGGVAVPAVILKPTADSDAAAEFKSFLRGAPVKAALNEGTNSQGGYAVPQVYSNDLVRPLTDLSYLRMAGAKVIQLQGTDAFHVPSLSYASAASLTAEAVSYTENEPTMADTLFQPWKLTRLAKVSEELAADSRFDLWGQILKPDYAQSFAAAENTYFTTGPGSSQPAGVVTGATSNNLTLATGNTLLIPADSVLDLYFALDYKYRANAVFMMNDATLKVVRKLKDTQNRYLFEPNSFAPGAALQTSQNPGTSRFAGTLLGKPVITNNSMAVPAANAKTILFGDFSYYWIADWAGLEMQRLSELYAANGQVGFRAFHRTDAHLMLTAAMALMVQSAT